MLTLSRLQAAISAGAILALLVAFFVQTARIEGFKVWPISMKGLKVALAEERSGRLADRARYAEAQRKAADLNKAEVQRIETHQQRITANVEADLTSRLERLRSELRRQGSANQGAARGTGASGVPQGTGPAPSQTQMCIPTEQYVYGAELEEKLDQWITWYEQQRGVQR